MNLLPRLQALLFGPVLRLPPGLADELIPDGVTLREGRLVPALGGLLARMNGPAAAVTLRRTIVFHPGATVTHRLLAHELAHVRQWEQDLLFPVRYTLESLRHGYRNNRYERQAREAEACIPAYHLPQRSP